MILPILLRRRGPVVRAGSGLFARQAGRETLLYTASAPGFSGSWSVAASIEGEDVVKATVGRGLVNGLEPVVKGKPISSGVVIEGRVWSEDERAWVGIVVSVDKDGRLEPAKQADVLDRHLTIEIRKDPRSGDATGAKHFHPIAMVLKSGTVHQMAWFDYRHSTAKKLRGFRHFFDVA